MMSPVLDRETEAVAPLRAYRMWIVLPALVAAAVLVVAVMVGVVLAVIEMIRPSELWDAWGAFQTGCIAATVLGLGPAIVLGAPVYGLLRRGGRARWRTVLALGAALGSLVALFDVAFLGWGIAAGAAVAGLTHVGAGRWLGAGPPRDEAGQGAA